MAEKNRKSKKREAYDDAFKVKVYPQKRNVRECWNEMSVKVDVKRGLERVILTISIETKCP